MTAPASSVLIGLVTTSPAVMETTPLSNVRLEGELGACILVRTTDR